MTSPRNDPRRISGTQNRKPGSAENFDGVVTGVDETENYTFLKHIRGFREYDTDCSGEISVSELQEAMTKAGHIIPDKEFKQFAEEVDVNKDGLVSFPEYMDLARKLKEQQTKSKGKSTRIPRAYIEPDNYAQYTALFHQAAGDDGAVTCSELQDFFVKNGMKIPTDRLQAIMTEVDDDGSGMLELDEFMVLLIKALGLKRRKVGPDHCSASQLKEEGWAIGELRKTGYSCASLIEVDYPMASLMHVFNARELLAGGASVKELVEHGWDCANAREAGFRIEDLVHAGASVRKIRNAGFNDMTSVTALRKLDVDALRMKHGGFSLNELRFAGYSTADLRLAGFSNAGLQALEKMQVKAKNADPLKRQGTLQLRAEAEQFLQQVMPIQRQLSSSGYSSLYRQGSAMSRQGSAGD